MAKASHPGAATAPVQALRLLALEMAAAASARQRRQIDAAAQVLSILFDRFLTQDALASDWPDRDRLVISPALHPVACALARLLGREELSTPADEKGAEGALAGSRTESGMAMPGTALSRGTDLPMRWPGHSLAAGTGLALAARILRQRFGPEVFDHATCMIIDEAEVEPGVAQETIAIAPCLQPHRLFVFHLTPEGTEGDPGEHRHCLNHLARFAAAGWHVQQARAEEAETIIAALEQGADQGVATWEERRPVYVAVRYSADAPAPDAHALRQELGWDDLPAGLVPDAVRDGWRLAGLRGRRARKEWQKRQEQLDAADMVALTRHLERPFPERFRTHMRELRQEIASEGGTLDMMAFLARMLMESRNLLSGLAVLSTLPDEALPAAAADRSGEEASRAPLASPSPIALGMRPAALAALLTGMSAHAGLRPAGLVRRHQLESMLPVLAEAARAGLPLTVLVLDDEPCHTALHEVLPAGVAGYAPADAVELVECWQLCVQQEPGPAVILTPADEREVVRVNAEKLNLCAFGAYELFSSGEPARVTVFASGRQLAAALQAGRLLDGEGFPVRVVAVPAPQRLKAQETEHLQRIMGNGQHRLLVAAGDTSGICPTLMAGASVMSPCVDGVPLSGQRLVERIVREVRRLLGAVDATGGNVAGDAAGEAPENSDRENGAD